MKKSITSALLVGLALLTLGLFTLEGQSQQPFCRTCNVAPAQSSYRQFVAPSGYTTHDGSYSDNGHHRRRDVRIVSVAQINPAYVSSYSPDGYDSTTQADILAQIRALSTRLDQLTALAAAQKTGGGAVTVPSNPGSAPTVVVSPAATPAAPGAITVVPPAAKLSGPASAAIGLAVLNAKCAACHQQGKLQADQRFTLLDSKGNLVTLTDKQKLSVFQKAYHAEMPPPNNSLHIPPLTDAEVAGIADVVR